MSPSGARSGDARAAFGEVKLPWLLLTGTQDRSPLGDMDPEARRTVFPALPPGGKYELVLAGAEHLAFTDTVRPGQGPRNPNHHRAILALTTAFWDTYLRQDTAARKWLDGEGARGVLEKEDLWQRK